MSLLGAAAAAGAGCEVSAADVSLSFVAQAVPITTNARTNGIDLDGLSLRRMAVAETEERNAGARGAPGAWFAGEHAPGVVSKQGQCVERPPVQNRP